MPTPNEPTPVGAKGDIRCFCSRTPLLGIYAVDTDGRPFVHVKVWKQGRLYTEMVVKGDAELSMKCRECYRWYRIFIRTDNKQPQLIEIQQPEVENADRSLVVDSIPAG